MTHTTPGQRTAIVTGAARGIGAEVAGRPAYDGPAGQVGEPEDIAHTASSLVSREAGFVSGQVIHLAGAPVGR